MAETALSLVPADDPGARRRPATGGYDAGEAAMALAPDMREYALYTAGRGWFARDQGGLWEGDAGSRLLGRVQDSDVWWRCRRGTTTRAILSELEPQLLESSAAMDGVAHIAGLPWGAGVVDLVTGDVRKAAAEDRVSRHIGAVPDRSDEPKVFLRVLHETLAGYGDVAGIVAWLRWWFHTALTGDCRFEQAVFLHGPPGTGKTTIADTLAAAAGTYAATVAAQHVVGDDRQHRSWLARLDGVRLVRLAEMPARGGIWNSADLLALISGEKLEANLMRRDPYEFRSRASVLATGNDVPRAAPTSGIWRRLAVVECRNAVPAARRDPTLAAQLRGELGFILGWAMGSASVTDAMPVPAELAAATEAVSAEQNPVDTWIREHFRPDPDGRVFAPPAYEAYCSATADPVRQNAFTRAMAAAFGASRPVKEGGRAVRAYRASPADR